MIKQKLIAKRKEKGVSQAELASYIGVEQSQYCRRENGEIHITKKEWNKLAKYLNVPLSEIYEPQEVLDILVSDAETNAIIKIMQNYIQRLEEENKTLKEENCRLKTIVKSEL